LGGILGARSSWRTSNLCWMVVGVPTFIGWLYVDRSCKVWEGCHHRQVAWCGFLQQIWNRECWDQHESRHFRSPPAPITGKGKYLLPLAKHRTRCLRSFRVRKKFKSNSKVTAQSGTWNVSPQFGGLALAGELGTRS
jgi:hypothetical protein